MGQLQFHFSSTLKLATDFPQDFQSDKVQLEEQILNPKTAYALAPFRPELLDQCVKVKNKFLNITHFVHVGIGGSSLGPEMVILSNPSDLASSRCLRSSDALMFDPTLLFLAIALFVDFNVGTKTPKRIRGTVCTLVSDVEESVITSPVV